MASGSYANKQGAGSYARETTQPVPRRTTRSRTLIEEIEGDGTDTETLTFSEKTSITATTATPSSKSKQTATKSTRKNTATQSKQTTRPRKLNTNSDTIILADKVSPTNRPTRRLPDMADTGETGETRGIGQVTTSAVKMGLVGTTRTTPIAETQVTRNVSAERAIRSDIAPVSPLKRHEHWLRPWIVCTFFAVAALLVLTMAGIYQRNDSINLSYSGEGQSYSIQVGGKDAGKWATPQAAPIKRPIIAATGPYAVMGKPTISAAFINQVLAAYNSPAAGKGQALYDMGVKYQIDPVFALAFFLHESSMGTKGEAQTTLSLGNLRCYTGVTCVDQNRGGYAQYATWEDGFQAWYELIHNYYIATRGLVTVDQIIPVYAPTADNNNETAYINSLKHTIDTWHAGQIFVN